MAKKGGKLEPQQQSHIDGMCGLYATLNACKYLLEQDERWDNRLFKHLCAQGIPDLFPTIMYEGTGTDGVRRLLESARLWARKARGRELVWSAPMWRGERASAADFFRALRDIPTVDDEAGRVFVLGLGAPWDHWTVMTRCDAKKAWFFDSWGLETTAVSSFTLDKSRAGEGAGKKIMIDFHQTFMVRLMK